LIVHADHGIERAPATPLRHVERGSIRIREVEGQERVRRQVLECARPLGRADEIDTEAVSGGNEGLGAVRAGREEEEEASQSYILPGV